MARRRSFDTLGVLTPLMQVFWRQGCEHTTLTDLERATGLNRVSLYNAFGDKRAVFLAALRHYRRTVTQRYLAPLRTNRAFGQADIEQFFASLIRLLNGRAGGWGCLFTNSILEGEARDPAVRDLIQQHLQTIERHFRDALPPVHDVGTKASAIPTHESAVFLNLLVQGLFVVSRLPDCEERVAHGTRAIRRLPHLQLTPALQSFAPPARARTDPGEPQSSDRA